MVEISAAGNAMAPQVAADSAGNAVAVWQQSDGTRDSIWSGRFVPGSGWGGETLLETNDAGNASAPHVSTAPSGHAFAIWVQSDGVDRSIWSNRFVPGSGWGRATLIDTNLSGNASTPMVSVDPSGSAVAIWSESNGTHDSIWSNRFVPGSGWGRATLIGKGEMHNDPSPQVGVDAVGDAVAAWIDDFGDPGSGGSPHGYDIWSNRFVPGSGWGVATLVGTTGKNEQVNFAGSLHVAVDPSGNAVVVWDQGKLDGPWSAWANRFAPGSGWGIATRIEGENAESAFGPQVAVDSSGNATAVWEQWDGIRDSVWSNRFVPGSGWGKATRIAANDREDTYSPRLAVGAGGSATAVWVEETQDTWRHWSIWSNRFDPGSGWGNATRIDLNDEGYVETAQVAADESGNAVAVWAQYDEGPFSIWANRFVSPSTDALNPTLSIDPLPAVIPSGPLAVGGKSFDAGRVAKVEVRLDNGPWLQANGTTTWSVVLYVRPGPHAITARATAASGRLDEATIAFTVTENATAPPSVADAPYGPIMALAMLGAAAYVGLDRRRRSRPPD